MPTLSTEWSRSDERKKIHLLPPSSPLPSPQVLKDHIYVPLSDVQVAQEEELEKQRALSFVKQVSTA